MKAIITHARGGFINGMVLVDNENYEWLNKYKWHLNSKGYAVAHFYINEKRTTKIMHRLIMKEPEGMQIDHIDHNKLYNCKCNLRIVTNSQNSMNCKCYKKSSSKFKGVGLHKITNKWKSQIGFNNKRIYIGLFNSEIDAAKAYNIKAKELFGEYAYLNEV